MWLDLVVGSIGAVVGWAGLARTAWAMVRSSSFSYFDQEAFRAASVAALKDKLLLPYSFELDEWHLIELRTATWEEYAPEAPTRVGSGEAYSELMENHLPSATP